jgi:hypothetical protein
VIVAASTGAVVAIVVAILAVMAAVFFIVPRQR